MAADIMPVRLYLYPLSEREEESEKTHTQSSSDGWEKSVSVKQILCIMFWILKRLCFFLYPKETVYIFSIKKKITKLCYLLKAAQTFEYKLSTKAILRYNAASVNECDYVQKHTRV